MRWHTYCKNRSVFLLLELLCILLIFFFLGAFKISTILILLVCVLLVFVCLIGFLFEYMRMKRYYDEVFRIYERLEEKTLLADMIERPDFYEGEVFYDLLVAASKDMNDKIGLLKQQQKDYLEYIELWVHEIKTPLAGMQLYFKNHKTEDRFELQEQLARIENDVEQVLFYARSSNFNQDFIIEKASLEELIKTVIKENALILIQSHAQIDMQKVSGQVYTDSKWLRYIIKQIIENAVKYRKESLAITFSTVQEDSKLSLLIKDNGMGIKESDIQQVFKKGYTGTLGRQCQKSTGMGLYISEKLCTKLGIHIRIESLENMGTTVILEFPNYKKASY